MERALLATSEKTRFSEVTLRRGFREHANQAHARCPIHIREYEPITQAPMRTRPGRASEAMGRRAGDLPALELESAPLSAQTRRTYASKARQYLAWLAVAETDGDPSTPSRAGPGVPTPAEVGTHQGSYYFAPGDSEPTVRPDPAEAQLLLSSM